MVQKNQMFLSCLLYTSSNLTTVSQYAAIEALTGDQSSIEIMRQAFEERLNTIYPLLNEVPGFEAIKPQGAFYLFPNVKKAMEMKGYTCLLYTSRCV